MVAQLWEYTKNYQIVHFEQMDFMACQFYLNKAVIKTKGGEERLAK